MSNVLSLSRQDQIKILTVLGWSSRAISRETGVHRKTVKRYREIQSIPKVPADYEAVENEKPLAVKIDEIPLPSTRSTHVLNHTATIGKLFDQGLTAQRIYQDLVEEYSFAGSYDSIKRYIRKLRKKIKRYHSRLSHFPGREAQLDFGLSSCYVKRGKKYRKVWLFKITLCCSKHAYEELVESQDVKTFIQCHINAFKFFGGVPEIITLDNLKSGVLVASLYEPELNSVYRSFCEHYNVIANPCIPRKPEHKGVVERDIQYTKSNALSGRRFESLEEANLFLNHWNKRWARTRIHGSTKKQVWKHFTEIERPMLRQLPDKEFEHFEYGERKVDVNGCIEVKKNFYGVPHHLVGEKVVVHYTNSRVKVFKNEVLIIQHHRIYGKGKCYIPESCLPPWKHPNLESQERYYCNKAKCVGPNTYRLVYHILSKFDPLAIRKVRGILSLARQYSKPEMEHASYEAHRYKNYSYGFVKKICENQSNNYTKKFMEDYYIQNHESIRPLSEYQNIINERSI